MKYLLIIFLIIVLSTNVSALCEENQIDINTASAEELDEIIQIGPARAEQMITLRPFSSVDDMIRINGIGEVYLSAIKGQGLACVGEDEVQEEIPEEPAEEKEEEEETTKEEETVEEETVEEEHQEIAEIRQEETGPIELNMIDLNPKVIKSENDNEKLNNNYVVYSFVFFCVLIVVLFVLRRNKYKNEFR